MTIEFSNAKPAKGQSGLSVALLVLSCLFFFIPASLIVLGYYSSLPTGTLISPIPQGVLSVDKPQVVTQAPIVAEPQEPVPNTSSTTQSNSSQKVATLPANQKEIVVTDKDILESSQIYLINKDGDKSLYSVASKSVGQFVLSSNNITDTNRDIDYQIVNP